MKHLFLFGTCLKLLSSLALRIELVQYVEDIYDPETGDFKIIHIYEPGEDPSEEKRALVRQEFRNRQFKSTH